MIPDLVLLDYSLPDLRGDQICERLLQNKATARIPVVMMSGHVPEMMATAERCPNVVATIAKPFMSEALVQLVHETLAKGACRLAPPQETAAGWTVADQPARVAAIRSRNRCRHGNGKKPVKKAVFGQKTSRPPTLPPADSVGRTCLSIAPHSSRQRSRLSAAPCSAPPAARSSSHRPVDLRALIKVAEPISRVPAPCRAAPTLRRDIRPVEPALLNLPRYLLPGPRGWRGQTAALSCSAWEWR